MALMKEQPFLMQDPQLKSFVSIIDGYSSAATPKVNTETSPILQSTGAPFTSETTSKPPSLLAARMAKDRLGELSESFGSSSSAAERTLGAQYKRYAAMLGNNINNDIATRGSRELQQATKAANENYAKNFAPFNDKNITGFLNEYKDPSALARRIISPSEALDRNENTRRIMDLLPADKKSALAYAYLERTLDTEGKFDAKTFAKMIGDLGNEQFKTLFPDKAMQKKLLDYGRVRGMSEEALNLMYNPKTGQRNLSSWSYIMNAIKSGAEKGGAIGGPVLGKPIGAALGAVAAPAGLIVGSTGLAKTLTNPETRQKVIERILEKQKAGVTPQAPTQAEKLLSKYAPRILAAQNERNQNGTRQ